MNNLIEVIVKKKGNDWIAIETYQSIYHPEHKWTVSGTFNTYAKAREFLIRMKKLKK